MPKEHYICNIFRTCFPIYQKNKQAYRYDYL